MTPGTPQDSRRVLDDSSPGVLDDSSPGVLDDSSPGVLEEEVLEDSTGS